MDSPKSAKSGQSGHEDVNDEDVPLERWEATSLMNGHCMGAESSSSFSLAVSSESNFRRQILKESSCKLMNSLQAHVQKHMDLLITTLDGLDTQPAKPGFGLLGARGIPINHACRDLANGGSGNNLDHNTNNNVANEFSQDEKVVQFQPQDPDDCIRISVEDVKLKLPPVEECPSEIEGGRESSKGSQGLNDADDDYGTKTGGHESCLGTATVNTHVTLDSADMSRLTSRRSLASRRDDHAADDIAHRTSAFHLWGKKNDDDGDEDGIRPCVSEAKVFGDPNGFMVKASEKVQVKLAVLQKSLGAGSTDDLDPTTEEIEEESRCLKRFVHSVYFNSAATLLILVNAIFIAWQTNEEMVRFQNWTKSSRGEFEGTFREIGTFFNVIFAVELFLRIASDRLRFIFTQDYKWNLMDTLLVATGIIEIAMQTSANNLTFARTLRILRMVRILRVVRVVRFFDSLRKMVSALLNSLLSLFWLVLLLFLVLFVFAIGFMQAIQTDLQGQEDPTTDVDYNAFMELHGSVPRSMLSLLETISGSKGWFHVMGPIMGIHWWYAVASIFFVSFTMFGVMNVVTGIFVDRALYISQVDRGLIIREEMSKTQHYVDELKRAFHKMDRDGDGNLTRDEARHNLQKPEIKGLLAVLQLDVNEAGQLEQLCDLLDPEETNSIAIEDFVQACLRLRGVASSMDLCALLLEVSSVRARLEEIVEGLDERFNEVMDQLDHMSKLRVDTALSKEVSRDSLSSGSSMPTLMRKQSTFSMPKKLKVFKLPTLGPEAFSTAMGGGGGRSSYSGM